MKHLINNIRKYLKIYKHFWVVGVSLNTLYRFEAFMLMAGVALVLFINIAFFGLIIRSTNEIAGWNFAEILFLLGFFQFNWGLGKVFYLKRMEDCIEEIFDGNFDFYLLKPINSRFIAFTLPPTFKSVTVSLAAIVFLAYAILNLNISITLTLILLGMFYIIIGHILLYSTFQILIALTFYFDRTEDIFGVLEHAWQYARYPRQVFEGKLLTVLTYVLPVTIFAAFPASIMLSKTTLNIANILLPLAIALVFLVFSNYLYKTGVKNYSSASS